MTIDEGTKSALAREIAMILARKQRLALAGVSFDTFSKGPNTRRSDGDVVAHAIVMALAAAVNRGDIDDWFPDTGETGVRSIDYLADMRLRLIEPEDLFLGMITLITGQFPDEECGIRRQLWTLPCYRLFSYIFSSRELMLF